MRQDLLEKARSRLAAIMDYYKNEDNGPLTRDPASLMGGNSGVVLLKGLLYLATGENEYLTSLETDLDDIVEYISQTEILPTFCSGLAGIGWLFVYLHEKNILDFEINSFLEDLDSLLEEKIHAMIAEKNFDILHGAVGIALYFLKRTNFPIIENVIRALQECADTNGAETKWSRIDKDARPVYDLGLAHGNAGMLYFLGKCYEKKIQQDICRRMLHTGLNFYISNIQDTHKYGSFFASIKPAENYSGVLNNQTSRLAWCYGDLGILHTLYLTTRTIGAAELEAKFVAMLEKTVRRQKLSQTGVTDGGFCHGSSGLGYMYMSLYKKTEKPVFKIAAEFWLEQTLDFGVQDNGAAGYRFYKGENVWDNMTNMLTGTCGVGLFLANFLYEDLIIMVAWKSRSAIILKGGKLRT
jgi:lantibiotic modifying enzyme